MQTKLTLRLDSTLIEQAKQVAQERDVSLSQLVTEYFAVLTAESENKKTFEDSLPPLTRSLAGMLKDTTSNVEEYRRYLETKYA